MATLVFDRVNQLIVVQSPDTQVTVTELYDKSADYLDEPAQMNLANFVEAAGNFNLGGGEFTGVALRLLDWKVQFEDRAGPSIIECQVTQGDLISVDSGGAPQNAIEPSTFVFAVIRLSTAPAAIQPALTATDLAAVANEVWDKATSTQTDETTMGGFVVSLPKRIQNIVIGIKKVFG